MSVIPNLPAKVEYACIAVLELATSYGTGQPVQVRRIANRQGIPSRFLVQILLQLKAAGLVSSTRGASGGYQLIRDPAQVTLGYVMGLVEAYPAEVTSNAHGQTPSSRVLLEAWQEVANAQREMLQRTTFADLVDRVRQYGESMYYI
jgi:Rrf2 family protein